MYEQLYSAMRSRNTTVEYAVAFEHCVLCDHVWQELSVGGASWNDTSWNTQDSESYADIVMPYCYAV